MSEGDGTAAELQPDGNRRLVTDLAPWADTLSKGVAAIAIALYACGFLIVSLHHSNYGFIGTNPFRPRILAAGAWFLFLSVVPILSLTGLRGATLRMSWLQLAEFSYPYYFGCIFLSLLASPLFSFSADSEWPWGPAPHRWWWSLATILVLGLLIFLIDLKKCPRVVTATASVVFVLVCLQYNVRAMTAGRFEFTAVIMWFFAAGVLTVVELKVRSRGGDWEKTVFLLLGALFLFALFYYPHIKASWGGGAPVNVTIYFTKDSPISPNKAVSAQLVEESDEGYYIVGPNETRAIYVPRSAVALVYFSDKVSDSPLLRDSK